jgi:hydroxymethylglutaryl-CoA reductase
VATDGDHIVVIRIEFSETLAKSIDQGIDGLVCHAANGLRPDFVDDAFSSYDITIGLDEN